MALQFEYEIKIIEVMEGYLVTARMPEIIKDQLDICYNVQDQSIIIFEIRPNW